MKFLCKDKYAASIGMAENGQEFEDLQKQQQIDLDASRVPNIEDPSYNQDLD